MSLNLPASIASRQDLKVAILELQAYLQWAGQDEIKRKVTEHSYGQPPGLSPAAAELLRQAAAGQPLTKDHLSQLAESLETFAAAAPYVSITLAAPPSNSLKQTMVDWFRRNVRADLLVDFNFNSTMLGGMVIRYGSRVSDWSFKRQILANRQKFPEILRNV